MIEWLKDPKVQRTMNGWLVVQWIAHLPLVAFLYVFANDAWVKVSILYLALTAVYAIVVGHLGAWQAADVACRQVADADVQEVLDAVREQAP